MTTSAPTIAVTPRWKMPPSERMLLVAIVALLALRLVGLLNLPVFVDEALHISRVKDILAGGTAPDAFSNGKILSVWLTTPFMALPFNSLFTSRMAVIFFNVITALGTIGLGSTLYSRRIGLVAALGYLLMPYSFFLGRMALVDNFATALFAILLWLTARLVKGPVDFVAIFVLVIATTSLALSKLTGITALPIPIFAALMLSPASFRKLNTVRTLVASSLACLIVLLFVIQGFGLGEFAHRAPSNVLNNVRGNVWFIIVFYWTLLTPPCALLTLLAATTAIRQKKRVALWLLVATLFMILPYLPVANIFFSRYLMPSLVPLSVLLGAMVADWLAMGIRTWRFALVVLAIVWMLIVQILMIVAIPSAPLPEDDMWQYVSGWPSGYGIPELATELQALSSDTPIQVVSTSSWDVTGLGLLPYVEQGERLSLCFLNISNCAPEANKRTVLAVNRTFGLPLPDNIDQAIQGREKVWSYTRPHGQSSLELWADPQ